MKKILNFGKYHRYWRIFSQTCIYPIILIMNEQTKNLHLNESMCKMRLAVEIWQVWFLRMIVRIIYNIVIIEEAICKRIKKQKWTFSSIVTIGFSIKRSLLTRVLILSFLTIFLQRYW